MRVALFPVLSLVLRHQKLRAVEQLLQKPTPVLEQSRSQPNLHRFKILDSQGEPLLTDQI
jgi:hypothetical protein